MNSTPPLNGLQRTLLRSQMEKALQLVPLSLLAPLRGQRLLITGASGFFGVWSLLSIEVLNQWGWGIEVWALSRAPKKVWAQWPQWSPNPSDAIAPPALNQAVLSLAHTMGMSMDALPETQWDNALQETLVIRQHEREEPEGTINAAVPWLQWVVGGFEALKTLPKMDFILHMAGSSDKAGNEANPFEMLQSTLEGAMACASKAMADKAKWLLTSSGAVYGRRTIPDGARESDTVSSAPDPTASASVVGYGHAKRVAEWVAAQSNGVIARPFAFLGPLLPLDWHFAAGNFLRDALTGKGPQLSGDGSPVRAYMHPADLAAWLLALLGSGQSGEAYNVGSDEALSLWALAQDIAKEAGARAPQRARLPDPLQSPEHYVANIEKTKRMGLNLAFDRAEAIRSWIAFHRATESQSR